MVETVNVSRAAIMGNQVKVSIILPSLNVGVYIGECIESVLNQSLSDIEVICVDAGSTDGTREKLAAYAAKDSRVKVIDSGIKSYGYQMNLGILEATGDYIGIVETDDYVHPEMFERMYNAAKENDLDLIKTDFNYFIDYNGKRVFAPYTRDIEDHYDQVISLKDNPYALRYPQQNTIWSGLYRRDVIEKNAIRFHESPGASYQDTGFALLYTMYADRIMFIPDRLYNYRQDNAGASVRNDSKYAVITEEYRWIHDEMSKRDLSNAYFRALYGHFRLVSYKWNLGRLSPEAGDRFLADLQGEKAPDYDGTLIGEDEAWRNHAEKLLAGDKELLDEFRNRKTEQKKNVRELLDLANGSEQIVIVPAGRVCGSVIEFYELLGIDKVVAVADNAMDEQGKLKYGFTVESVEKAVQDHPHASFVVAVKTGSEEIVKQLTGEGIDRKNIKCVCQRPLMGRLLLTQIGGI